MKNGYFDLHVHSPFSFDYIADDPRLIDEMCQTALNNGLSGIAITDHYCVNQVLEGILPPCDFVAMNKAVCEAQERWRGKLHILRGIELGQPDQALKEAHEYISLYRPEFVIGSLHNVCGAPDFYFIDYENADQNELVRLWDRYFADMTKLLDFSPIHTLGHLGYPARYYSRNGFSDICDFNAKKEVIREIFLKMKDKGIALECNVSNLRSDPPGDTMFPLSLTEFYLDCGNRLITVGSDAHAPDHTGRFVLEITDHLLSKGCVLLSESF